MKDAFCHNEVTCHAIGEKRQNLINEIKLMLDKTDDRPCLVTDKKRAVPPLMVYPGYVNTRHPALQPPETMSPYSTFSCHRECHRFDFCSGSAAPVSDEDLGLPAAEENYDRKKPANPYENACTKQGMTSPGARFRVRNQSTELRGGVMLNLCDCIKRNGLQDKCPRTGCGEVPKCLAFNPGPCCAPALARRKYDRC